MLIRETTDYSSKQKKYPLLKKERYFYLQPEQYD